MTLGGGGGGGGGGNSLGPSLPSRGGGIPWALPSWAWGGGGGGISWDWPWPEECAIKWSHGVYCALCIVVDDPVDCILWHIIGSGTAGQICYSLQLVAININMTRMNVNAFVYVSYHVLRLIIYTQ